MYALKTVVCPVSPLRINSNVARVTGFLIAVMIGLYALTGNVALLFAIALDYFIRAATPAQYSPFSGLAAILVDKFKLGDHPIDKAPKIFAARVGFLFALTAAVLFWFNPTASLIVAFSLMAFALLESVFDLCVGCIVYTYLVLPIFRNA